MRDGAIARTIRSVTSAASMATRLPMALVLVSLVSLIVATVVGVRTGRDLGSSLTEDRLIGLRSSAVFDIEARMGSLERTSAALASSPQAVVAIERFSAAHADLSATPIDDLVDEIEEAVEAYRERYLEPLAAAGRELDVRDLVSPDSAAIYLQYHYAVDLGVVRSPAAIDDARDGSEWSAVHEVVHPVYRDVVDRLGLFDLHLVDAETATIVYSTEKRPDLGTSLDVGPFSGSFLAPLVDQVRESPDAGTVISDLAFYDPALLEPVGAVASPVMDGDRLVGVLVLMYEGSTFTDILTAGGDWERGGFPPTGESFLFGANGLALSDPRTFLEDPEAHLAASIEAGELSEEDARFIRTAGTASLTQRVAGETVDAGVDGEDEVQTRRTMVGGRAFSTVEAVDLDGVRWFVATEADVESAEGDLDEFVDLLVVGTAIFLVLLTFWAVAWGARIVRPVRAISDRLASGGPDPDPDPIDLPTSTPIEFRRLTESFESMSHALRAQQTQLADAREERLLLLRRLLPPAVAERVVSGELESLDEVPQATVVAVVVVGLGGLIREGASGANRELVDELHGELDALARRHGVERIKIVGDTYFAACGHARPYIDHAPRAFAFAGDAGDAVRDLGAAASGGLDVSVGMHTGSVTVGVAAATRLLYDVWGSTVTVAHHLSRRAGRGEILVSEETKSLLPDTMARSFEPVEGGTTVWSTSHVTAGRAR